MRREKMFEFCRRMAMQGCLVFCAGVAYGADQPRTAGAEPPGTPAAEGMVEAAPPSDATESKELHQDPDPGGGGSGTCYLAPGVCSSVPSCRGVSASVVSHYTATSGDSGFTAGDQCGLRKCYVIWECPCGNRFVRHECEG